MIADVAMLLPRVVELLLLGVLNLGVEETKGIRGQSRAREHGANCCAFAVAGGPWSM
jgi:hypothetical protein